MPSSIYLDKNRQLQFFLLTILPLPDKLRISITMVAKMMKLEDLAMKKHLALLFAVLMLVLTGCGNKAPSTDGVTPVSYTHLTLPTKA